MQRIPEEFLHFLWKTRRFDPKNLLTTHGAPVQILQGGIHNIHAGPDFLQARIRIGDRLWAGQVEIHVKSSDWIAHKHPFDPAYQNVILHVVWEEDTPIYLADGSRLPCLELKNRTPAGLFERYRQLRQAALKVPCTSRIAEVSPLIRSAWLDRMLIERLEEKARHFEQLAQSTQNDLEQMLRAGIARAFGLPANADALEDLLLSLPHTLLNRYRHNPLQIEALLFGQAGLLEGHFKDDWPQKLQREFRFLQKKHNLQPLSASRWKWSRMRPSSFPSLRIAQLAALCSRHTHWFDAFRQPASTNPEFSKGQTTSGDEVKAFFQIETSDYWKTHHHWERLSAKNFSRPGKALIERVLLNALAPFFFRYGQQQGDESFKLQALQWVAGLPAEDNRITRKWKDFGWEISSAEHSQAVLHLQRHYCEKRKCLHCAIGHQLIKE